jgi:hypothetical protein
MKIEIKSSRKQFLLSDIKQGGLFAKITDPGLAYIKTSAEKYNGTECVCLEDGEIGLEDDDMAVVPLEETEPLKLKNVD